MRVDPITVESADWSMTLRGLSQQGFSRLGFIAGVDQGGGVVEVWAAVSDAAHLSRFVSTVVSAGSAIPCACEVFPAADWHEREIHDLFGFEVVGHPELRPLLYDSSGWYPRRPPLLKATPLPARLRPWPGAAEPGDEQGRVRPTPGVEPSWRSRDLADDG